MILVAFKDISLVILPVQDTFQVKLAKLKILELLDFNKRYILTWSGFQFLMKILLKRKYSILLQMEIQKNE